MINIYTQDGQQSWQLLYNLNLPEVKNLYMLLYSDPTFKDFQTSRAVTSLAYPHPDSDAVQNSDLNC